VEKISVMDISECMTAFVAMIMISDHERAKKINHVDSVTNIKIFPETM
jgi:hypothetical protein